MRDQSASSPPSFSSTPPEAVPLRLVLPAVAGGSSRTSSASIGGKGTFGPGTFWKATAMSSLDGEWNVRRVSGVLPPLYGVRKRIDGQEGVTLPPLPVPLPFDVVGLELRYRGLLSGLVDTSSRMVTDWQGIARYRGRELGRFAMTRRRQRSQGLSSRSMSRQPAAGRAARAPRDPGRRRGWETLDAEPLDEIGVLSFVDEEHAERAVVPAALKHLGEKSLRAAARA